jgi:hypothetical protein
MASITTIADKFFVACETGKGWEGCNAYCTSGATFIWHSGLALKALGWA